jgi:hypothetical protein
VHYSIAVGDSSGWIVSNVAANELEFRVARQLRERFAARAQAIKNTYPPAASEQLSHKDRADVPGPARNEHRRTTFIYWHSRLDTRKM